MLIREALQQAHAAGVARLDAQWLLGHLLAQPRAWLLAHDDQLVPADAARNWPLLLARRAAGEPLAYVLGQHRFCGLDLLVTPAVLVPRPETEMLVMWALECLRVAPAATAIDLGTGSGAIALAIQHARPDAEVLATDSSADALSVASANAHNLGLALRLAQGSWWAAAGTERFGLAVSNPPYIAADDVHLQDLQHEPQSALTPGGDGLDALRQLVAGAPDHLLPGAWLLLEHGHDQGAAVRELLQRRGFGPPQTRADLAGLPRCTGAPWPGAN